ncbi:ATP-binding protein [Hydrogenophaga sp. 2FB]|uniref:ATP-binding protein n=1 Tax=Hydrogenophaga sp. 2FB TaxID=2502187 RepID=UPI0010F471DB|nr:ATP-binding protein [Hydrogenophaga sp. 2FB]
MTGLPPSTRGGAQRIACVARLANLPALQAMVSALCAREHLDDTTCHDLRLVVEEACVNVIHHAYPKGMEGLMALEVQLLHNDGPRRVVLKLEDQGKAFNPLSLAPANAAASADARAVGGLGVHLIRQLSDRQHYERHPTRGNVFTIEKFLEPHPSP